MDSRDYNIKELNKNIKHENEEIKTLTLQELWIREDERRKNEIYKSGYIYEDDFK